MKITRARSKIVLFSMTALALATVGSSACQLQPNNLEKLAALREGKQYDEELGAISPEPSASPSLDASPTPAPAASLEFVAAPGTATAGSGFTSFAVRAKDASGNVATSFASGVTLTAHSNAGCSATVTGTLSGDTATASSGVATFASTQFTNATTLYLKATSGSLETCSGAITVSAGAASQVVFTQHPSNGRANSKQGASVIVELRDANGNLTSSSAQVSLGVGTNPGSATLYGNKTVNASSGTATFTELELNQSGTGYTLAATSSGLTSGISNTFDLSSGISPSIAQGRDFACSLRADKTAYCWGGNATYQLGNGSTGSVKQASTPVAASVAWGTLTGATALPVGGGAYNYQQCAIVSASGKLYCWGRGSGGFLGDNTSSDKDRPVSVVTPSGSGEISGIASVSLNNQGSCATHANGSVYCWGANTTGRVGNNTTSAILYPAQVVNTNGSGALSGIAQVAAGVNHSCAVATGGAALYCWGGNANSNLGNNGTSQSNYPVQTPGIGGAGTLSSLSGVTAGINGSCALHTNGLVYCWGLNTNGETGTNIATSPVGYPTVVKGTDGSTDLSGIQHIALGQLHGCGAKNDGTVYCWGENTYGQLGNNSSTTVFRYAVQVVHTNGSGTLTGITKVAAGYRHSCGLHGSNGTVYCWGYDSNGQLGNNATSTVKYPVQVLGETGTGLLSGITEINTGYYHTCGLRGSTGEVFCWGYNVYGQIGNYSPTSPIMIPSKVVGLAPVATGTLTGISQIAAGYTHACALIDNGEMYCWGGNSSGQIGDNSDKVRAGPTRVKNTAGTGYLSGVTSITAGYDNSCAVLNTGAAYCWGYNTGGRLGDNTTSQRNVPAQVVHTDGVNFLSGITAIAGSYQHACALDSGGSVYCWGTNSDGQLGNNSTSSRNLAAQVVGTTGSGALSGIASIAPGRAHTCARATNGAVYCWGDGANGAIGENSTSDRLYPVQVKGANGAGNLSGITAVSSAYYHSCAVTNAGDTYCWGDNADGQIGDNTTSTDRLVPVQVVNSSVTGNFFGLKLWNNSVTTTTCAFATPSQPYCWGYNNEGQIGDNTSSDRRAPTKVLNMQ